MSNQHDKQVPFLWALLLLNTAAVQVVCLPLDPAGSHPSAERQGRSFLAQLHRLTAWPTRERVGLRSEVCSNVQSSHWRRSRKVDGSCLRAVCNMSHHGSSNKDFLESNQN